MTDGTNESDGRLASVDGVLCMAQHAGSLAQEGEMS